MRQTVGSQSRGRGNGHCSDQRSFRGLGWGDGWGVGVGRIGNIWKDMHEGQNVNSSYFVGDRIRVDFNFLPFAFLYFLIFYHEQTFPD